MDAYSRGVIVAALLKRAHATDAIVHWFSSERRGMAGIVCRGKPLPDAATHVCVEGDDQWTTLPEPEAST